MDLVTYMETTPYRPLPWDARVIPLDFPYEPVDPIDTYVAHDSYEPFAKQDPMKQKPATYAAAILSSTRVIGVSTEPKPVQATQSKATQSKQPQARQLQSKQPQPKEPQAIQPQPKQPQTKEPKEPKEPQAIQLQPKQPQARQSQAKRPQAKQSTATLRAAMSKSAIVVTQTAVIQEPTPIPLSPVKIQKEIDWADL